MKTTLLVISCLSLLCLAAAPRLRRPGALAPLTIRDANGLAVRLTPPLTITVSETGPPPTPVPVPVPVPQPGAVVITAVVAATGAPITQAAGGSIVFVRGSGMGAGGIVRIAGQVCAVLDYLPYQITIKLPVVAISQAGSVVVAPAGLQPGTSLFSFTIVGAAPVPVPVPPPVPPPVPVPVPPPVPGLVNWPAGTGVFWQRREGRYVPYPPKSYPWKLPSTPGGIDYPLTERPPWAARIETP